MQLLWHAAERGYVPAIDSLASEYASGQHIPKNILQSYLWSTLAGKFGDANAPKTIAYLNEKQPLNEMQKERLASGVDSWLRYFQRTNDPESPGNVALSQGNLYAALQDDVNALQSLPDPAPIDVDKRLREQAITIVQRLKAPPSLPASATQYEIYGKTAAQSATDPDGLLGAIDNLRKATNVAPWWADGYYNLAVVEERAKDYADAARSLGFYLLAKPNAPDAASVQSRIYTLQFKAYHP